MGKRHQVVIVGGGPVGIGLALELGLRGITCAVIEHRRGMHNIPKGQNLTARTLEHFWSWGVVDDIRAARIMPPEIENNGIVAYGNLMSEHWFATKGREIVSPYYFQKLDRLPQYLMEDVLRRKLATLSNVEACYGWDVVEVEQDKGGVRVSIAEDGGAARDTLEADYVVGCDGGHSTVREQIGITRGGTDYDQPMVLTVFRSKAFHEGLSKFPVRSTYRVMNPEYNGYWQFFGRVIVGESFFFHSPIPAGAKRENFDFHGLIQKVAGFQFPADFDHVGFWDLRVAVADTYQVGRAFIAGDAAHSHPPYGGYGVNNGLEDARNLGWKLAAHLQGWGSDALLASYSDERRPIFKETAEYYIQNRLDHERSFLERYSPQRDKAEFVQAFKGLEDDVGSRVATYEPHYEGSPVVFGPHGGKSSASGSHMFKARAGHHLPPQVLSSGRNVFQELGSGFSLLAFDAGPADTAGLAGAAARLDVPLKVVIDSRASGREAYQAKLVLVRPDHYVAWTSDAAPQDPEAILKRVVGRA